MSMSKKFTITKTEKESKFGKKITFDIKSADSAGNTISGTVEEVVAQLHKVEKDKA